MHVDFSWTCTYLLNPCRSARPVSQDQPRREFAFRRRRAQLSEIINEPLLPQLMVSGLDHHPKVDGFLIFFNQYRSFGINFFKTHPLAAREVPTLIFFDLHA